MKMKAMSNETIGEFLDNRRLTKQERVDQEAFCKRIIGSLERAVKDKGPHLSPSVMGEYFAEAYKENRDLFKKFLYFFYELDPTRRRVHGDNVVEALIRSVSRYRVKHG